MPGTMQKLHSITLTLVIVAVVATAAVLYQCSAIDSAGGAGERMPDAESSSVEQTVESARQASAALAPERGIWPGLPSLETTVPETYLNSAGSDRQAVAAGASEVIDESATLLELVDEFDGLSDDQRGRVAFRIAKGWRECMFYRPIPDEEIDERVEGRFRSGRDFVTSMLAQAPEGPLVDEAVEKMAGVDPAAVRAGIREDELRKRQLCSGTEDIDWRERTGKELEWLREAARLGNYGAQHAFLNKVFSNTRPSGQAMQLADDKQLVLDIVAGRLQRRDLLVLEHLARFVGAGYYGPPDPLSAHAYAKAAILAGERLGQSSWKLNNPDPARVEQFIAAVSFNTRGFTQELTASELAEAEDRARQIALLEAQP
jgi:hypothetical protein